MNKKQDAAVAVINESSSVIEGGLSYPVGYIVVGVATQEDASRLQKAFLSKGLGDKDCVVVTPSTMAATASEDLDHEGFLSSLGSSGHVREKQLQLAQQGYFFLMIKASSDDDRKMALEQLTLVPVKYAVHYRRLVIEDLIEHISSASADSVSARKA